MREYFKHDYDYGGADFKMGDAVVVFGALIWLTVAVGPWWLGVALLALGWLLNRTTQGRAP
jgi:hypothetical protein